MKSLIVLLCVLVYASNYVGAAKTQKQIKREEKLRKICESKCTGDDLGDFMLRFCNDNCKSVMNIQIVTPGTNETPESDTSIPEFFTMKPESLENNLNESQRSGDTPKKQI